MQLGLLFGAFICKHIFKCCYITQDKTVLDWLWQKIKTSEANNFVIFWNFIKFHFWKVILIQMSKEDSHESVFQFGNDKRMHAKSCDNWEKRVAFEVLFFQEHRYLFVKLTTYLAGSPQKRRPRRLQTADRADHADCADRAD